jgi:dihydroorotase
MTMELTITRPDDWHLHLRDHALLKHTVASAAQYFGRSIVMPNLDPPVTDAEQVLAYQQRILEQRPASSNWQPLMVIYLTDSTSDETVFAAKRSGVTAAKLYPAGATTNSESGVTALEKVFPALQAMTEVGMPLLVHGEVTSDEIDIFDREKQFIDLQLKTVVEKFPDLKIVLEHVSTIEAVQFVQNPQTFKHLCIQFYGRMGRETTCTTAGGLLGLSGMWCRVGAKEKLTATTDDCTP